MGEVKFAVSSKTVMGGELQQFGIELDQEVGVGVFDSQGRKYAMIEKFRCVQRGNCRGISSCLSLSPRVQCGQSARVHHPIPGWRS